MPNASTAVADTLCSLGGIATWRDLAAIHGDGAIRAARRSGQIVAASRGRYALAVVEGPRRFAHAHTAVLAGPSAARWYGWGVLRDPARPWIIVPRHRKVTGIPPGAAHIRYADLLPSDHHLGVTTRLRTVLDSARWLPDMEALAIADSALRDGVVSPRVLHDAAKAARGPGASQVRHVATLASDLAANPLESAARALCVRATDAVVTPQLQVWDSGLYAKVDLGIEHLRIAIEVEGYAFHGGPAEFARDCVRYSELVAFGWYVLRFTYDDILHHPAWVCWAVAAAVDRRRGRRPPEPPRRTRAGRTDGQ